MRQVLKQYFIPNKNNDFRPFFFREDNILMFATVIVLLFFAPFLYSGVLTHGSYFSAVLPAALADLTNIDRASNGLPFLLLNKTLQEAAQRKANDMAAKGYFAHVAPDGKTPWYWFREAGYRFSHAGENLAIQFSDSVDVERAWMDSPGHRANILSNTFTEIGIATAVGVYQGRETIFIAQFFGKPAKKQARASIPAEIFAVPKIPASVGLHAENFKPQVAQAEVEVIAQDNMFIAVRDIQDSGTIEAETALSQFAYAPETSRMRRAAVSPVATADYIYILLGVVVGMALILDIVIEIKRQHPRHIVYAAFLVALIGGAIYLHQVFFIGRVIVV